MESEARRVLVADDEMNMRRVLEAILRREGYEVVTAANGLDAFAEMNRDIHTVITDLKMPGLDGMGLLRKLQTEYPEVPVVMITAHGSVESAVEAVKLGAFDHLEKPFEQEQIRQIVAKAMKTHELARRDARPEEPTSRGRFRLIGESPAIRQIFAVVEKVANTPSTVLITGESGTGKELIARALHENSSRHAGPFIKTNCAAIPKTLMESEMFGYEKGAFTGAVGAKPGRFELAHGGTLFLDEIGEIPVEMQVKLLRVLQESEFERVGGIKTIKVDVRLVTATNRDLLREIAEEAFREDLFYRLNVVPIHIPPLRERREDIPLLADHFITKFNSRLRKEIKGISAEAVACLGQYNWPGNIRELENLMERTMLFCEGPQIEARDLPPEMLHLAGGGSGAAASSTSAAAQLASGSRLTSPSVPVVVDDPASGPSGSGTGSQPQPTPTSLPIAATAGPAGSLKEAVRAETERVERGLIIRALDETNGNVTQAARKLKISRKSLQTKMKEFGLRDRESTREG